jgi:hypothetical protein
MTRSEIDRVQDYLRRTFSNDRLAVIAPSKPSAPVEVHIGGEFIGVLHRDEEEGEISYSLLISILEEDLPPAKTVGP